MGDREFEDVLRKEKNILLFQFRFPYLAANRGADLPQLPYYLVGRNPNTLKILFRLSAE